MPIFSEIYGAYFRIAAKLMDSASVTEKQIMTHTANEGFRDSILFLPQKLIPQNDNSDWGLFKRNSNGTLSPIIKHTPISIMTDLRKRWLKAKLFDPKIRLFLDDDALAALDERLSSIEPLYKRHHLRYTDRFSDGDDFLSEDYRKNFRCILRAIKEHEILDISFVSGHDRHIRHCYLPLKLEYSAKNDKFRVYCYKISRGCIHDSGIINIGRIYSIHNTGIFFDEKTDMENYFRSRRAKVPVTVKITPERNGVERFLMEFSSYEKHTERDLSTGTVTAEIKYDFQDETELLIRLLSFGSVIEIIGPPHFRKLAADRVKKQYEFLFGKDRYAEKLNL